MSKFSLEYKYIESQESMISRQQYLFSDLAPTGPKQEFLYNLRGKEYLKEGFSLWK